MKPTSHFCTCPYHLSLFSLTFLFIGTTHNHSLVSNSRTMYFILFNNSAHSFQDIPVSSTLTFLCHFLSSNSQICLLNDHRKPLVILNSFFILVIVFSFNIFLLNDISMISKALAYINFMSIHLSYPLSSFLIDKLN